VSRESSFVVTATVYRG